ncbi:MAG: hypothetical protein BWY09_02182 [Candidatus Hydrogenedentes bacterium ADurb.Bin179]|nr:MAG: hypothetical protein BWY09_02182 [Candidatus Hydrogenedentes bacterium ADurb.Bin179]
MGKRSRYGVAYPKQSLLKGGTRIQAQAECYHVHEAAAHVFKVPVDPVGYGRAHHDIFPVHITLQNSQETRHGSAK